MNLRFPRTMRYTFRMCATPTSPRRVPLRLLPLDYACMLAFLAYAAGTTVTPICLVHLSREFSLSLTAGGGIEVVRALLLLTLLLGSAFGAARWGKARSVGGSALLMGIGLALYTVSPSYGLVLLAGAMIGGGGGMIEGLINPLIQDLHPRESGRYLNLHNAFWSLGVLITVLAGGELLTRGLSWRTITGAVGVTSIAAGILFLILDRRSPHVARHSATDVWRHKTAILKAPRFWLFAPLMFIAGGAEGAFTFWSASYIQLHAAGSARMGGIGTACFAGGMMLGRLAGGWFAGQAQLRRLILVSALTGVLISLVVPRITSLAALFPVLFVAGLSIACFWPSLQSYAADRMEVESTSLFILMSCAGIPGFALVAWVIGFLGDRTGLGPAFYLVPLLLMAFIVLMLIERGLGPAPAEEPSDDGKAMPCDGC